MDGTEKHDLCLACETRASDIFKSTKKKTVQRAQVWQQIADTCVAMIHQHLQCPNVPYGMAME